MNARMKEETGKEDIFWIRDPRQLEALISSRRQEIGDYLAAAGPKSAKEIAAALGTKPSALYHHLEIMQEVGLVKVAGSRIVNRRKENVYDTPARRMRWGISLTDPSKREIWRTLNAAQCRQTDRDFARGIERSNGLATGAARNLRTFRLVGAPDPGTLAEINRRLDEIAELMWESAGNDEDLIAVTCVTAPVSDRSAPRRAAGTRAPKKRRRASAS